MEMFGNSNGGRGGGGGAGGQNGNINNNSNNPNLAWDIWNMSNAHNAHHDHSNANNDVMSYMTAATTAVTIAEPPSSASSSHALLHNVSNGSVQVVHQDQHFTSFYGGDHYQHHESRILHGTQYLPDPHPMCLKLGKRHYFEDAPPPHPFDHRHVAGAPLVIGGVMKRGKSFYGGGGGGGSTSSSMKVPRCQVEGCHVALVSAKEYHRRHKVCEMHSKASKVIVLGLEQRFCQQCSRFHVVSEFDESKRSCRRRLAGHNERRRKCSHDSLARGSSQEKNLMAAAGRFPYLSSLPTGHSALSLLSSSKSGNDSWVLSPTDFSSRSHAALSELIAENRASIMARQVVSSSSDRPTSNWEDSSHYNNHSTLQDCGESLSQSWPSSSVQSHHRHQQQQMYAADQHSWERFNESGAHLTLELMQQPPSPAYDTLLPARDSNAKAEDEECELWKWNSFQGASVV